MSPNCFHCSYAPVERAQIFSSSPYGTGMCTSQGCLYPLQACFFIIRSHVKKEMRKMMATIERAITPATISVGTESITSVW